MSVIAVREKLMTVVVVLLGVVTDVMEVVVSVVVVINA